MERNFFSSLSMSAAAVWFHGVAGVYIECIESGILDLNIYINFNKGMI